MKKLILSLSLLIPILLMGQVGILGLDGTNYVKTPIKYHISEDSTVFTGDLTGRGLIKGYDGILCGAGATHISPYKLTVYGSSLTYGYTTIKSLLSNSDSLVINTVSENLIQLHSTTHLTISSDSTIIFSGISIQFNGDSEINGDLITYGNIDTDTLKINGTATIPVYDTVSITTADLTFGATITIDSVLDVRELFKLQLQDTSKAAYKVNNSVIVNEADTTLYIYLGKWKQL